MNDLVRRPTSSLGLSTFEEMDKLLDNLWSNWGSGSPRGNQPSIDIYGEDDNKSMVVEVLAPGFERKDIDVNVRSGFLEIRGQRKDTEKQEDENRSYLVREQSTTFARRIVLPEGVDTNAVSAELDKGVLKVTMPIDRPEAKKIEIAEPIKKAGKKLASIAGKK